ncbi:hypothetical protein CLOP_g22628 [Closterium sp. NIES-67]|nr:hypothetical protein CLOP_g22628 [Closterium sp. NIES-67]
MGSIVNIPGITSSGSTAALFHLILPQRYVIVLLTLVCSAVCYIERVGFSIAYTAIAIREGVDQATKGWVMSAFYYGYASSQVPGSWASQKYGGRRVLTYSFVAWSVLCVLTPTESPPDSTGSGPNTVTLVVIRLLVGIAQGFIFPAIHTVLAQWTPPHEKSRAVSLSMSGMYLGAGIAMQILPGLVASRGPESVFQLVAAMGVAWTILWVKYASDPPGGPTAFAHVPAGGVGGASMGGIKSPSSAVSASGSGGMGGREEELQRLKRLGEEFTSTPKHLKTSYKPSMAKDPPIPWVPILMSAPVWAIVANNFTFHYALYVLMNWLPTYFHQALNTSLHNVGSGKAMPYYIMTLFSNIGGVLADHLIAKRYLTVGGTRKVLNTIGFFASAVALALTPVLKSVNGAVLCSSLTLGACAIARAGFAVNHMDIAPRFAGVVMGVSNTAGTMAGVVGVAASGLILEARRRGGGIDPGWWWVFFTPASLCVVSALIFDAFATGERVFE